MHDFRLEHTNRCSISCSLKRGTEGDWEDSEDSITFATIVQVKEPQQH